MLWLTPTAAPGRYESSREIPKAWNVGFVDIPTLPSQRCP